MSFFTARVLAGGGSLGAVQVGMLQALIEAGVRFDLVVGSSVGAINGAYFATQPNPAGVAALAKTWSGLRKP
ncbi:patatin-like phospholipase family protein, partial [Stutzerimonas stutzeri]|uniref:patatin-like phospholipase family protein n=1 Tax=Stutzerimonas stutzeri TaxID=316 RepID=UPI00210B7E16